MAHSSAMPQKAVIVTSSPNDLPTTTPTLPATILTRPTKRSITPPTSDRNDRTSFSSIHENHAGVAQSFLDSKTSSYLRNEFERLDAEEAIEDELLSLAVVGQIEGEGEKIAMLNPGSKLHGPVCPCDGFKGWKSISIGGRTASKSFGDLRGLARESMDLGWELVVGEKDGGEKEGCCPVGQSPFEMLPNELLGSIIDQLATDIPPNGFTARNIDLMALLLTSRRIHSATLATLYKQITFPHSRIFAKFLNHVTKFPSLGTLVRRLDFSHFNPTGAGLSARARNEMLNLIPSTLLQCLHLVPNLRDFLAQEHVDEELSVCVLRELFCEMPKMRALDFCACSHWKFKEAFAELLDGTGVGKPMPDVLLIERLSLHECNVLPASTYSILLPKLVNLTHLDVAHTRIMDSALASIPHTARLTHLNLSQCASLKGPAVVAFLEHHPAAKTLVYLNLSMDAKYAELLTADDLDVLLPILNTRKALRFLSLKGSKMHAEHMEQLIPLTKHLEELGLGRHMTLSDIAQFFATIPTQPQIQNLDLNNDIQDVQTDEAEIQEEEDKTENPYTPHQLHYIDLSDLTSSFFDLTALFASTSPFLKSLSLPLEVLEVSAEIHRKLSLREASVRRNGWVCKELGRRYWLVRDIGVGKEGGNGIGGEARGGRWWKMGATYWGMRKVPVVVAEVGGIYGHYMFKR